MRKSVIAISVILLLALVSAIGCSNSDSSNGDKESPEAVIRGFLEATQVKNIQQMASYCTTEYVDTLDLELFEEQTEGVNAKYTNISTEVVEQNENDAEVNISYDALFNVEGEEFSDNIAATILLIRVDNSWLINAASDARTAEEAYDITKNGTEEISPERFTEYYILDPEGKAGNYPRYLSVGEEGNVIMAIVNRENTETTYKVEITIDGEPVNRLAPVTLEHEEIWEEKVGFSPVNSGTGQKVEFLLYKDGEDFPYSDVHLWIDVSE